MWYLKKEITISASHILNHLDYESKCKQLHGHDFKITVFCKSDRLDKNGMVIDFKHIANIVNQFDHAHLNELMDEVPTSENLAKYLADNIPNCYRVVIQETEGNEVTYEQEIF